VLQYWSTAIVAHPLEVELDELELLCIGAGQPEDELLLVEDVDDVELVELVELDDELDPLLTAPPQAIRALAKDTRASKRNVLIILIIMSSSFDLESPHGALLGLVATHISDLEHYQLRPKCEYVDLRICQNLRSLLCHILIDLTNRPMDSACLKREKYDVGSGRKTGPPQAVRS